MPNDATRLKLIRALIEAGHVLERVVISHDICYRTCTSRASAATATATSSATSCR